MHETISIHKAITYSKSKGVVIVSKHHNKNIMPEFRNACLQEYAKDALIGSFPFPPKILFCKIHKYKYFKHSTKTCLKYF